MEQPIPSISSMRLALRVIGALFLGLVTLGSELDAAQFTLTWTDNSTNESGFRIERSTNGTTFTEIATVGTNVVSYVDAGLPNSTTYWYRIRAYNSAGSSGFSNVATGTTPPLLSNNAPTISTIANRSIYTGSATGIIPFAVGDVETAAGSLAVTVATSNTTLVPVSGVALGGSGANRTINVTPASGRTGSATITVRVSDGTLTTSGTFVVTVYAAGTGPTLSAQPQATTITPGGALTLSVTALGAGTVTYQWYRNDTAIAGATSATYSVPLAQRFHAGSYHVVVTSSGVSISSRAAAVSAGSGTSSGRLVNLSSRASVGTGENILIPGFVVAGSANKRLLVRMVGPGLAPFGLTGVLADPKLVLKRHTTSGYVDLATSLDWSDGGLATAMRQAFVEVGAFGLPSGSGDAAMVVDLAPGMYSVFASDEQDGRTGLAMVEIYDADATTGGAALNNISTRGFLGTGSHVMIAGFVVEGGPTTVLVRTVGPGLAKYGASGLVANPAMELLRRVDGVDEVVAANDDWSSNGDAEYTAEVTGRVSAFALAPGSRDAAFVVTLPAGIYSVVAQGVGSTTGMALLEIYAVP